MESKPSTDNKAFELYEMRKEWMNIDYNLKLIEKNCTTLNINLKKSEIVQKEVDALDETTRVYDICGRIFVLSTKKNLADKLAERKKLMISELDSQNEKKKYLEKNWEEQSKAYLEVAKATEAK